jgi:glutamine amidotransferase
MRARVAIIDYGAGNVQSLLGAFKDAGALAFKAQQPTDLGSAHLLVLPGVGHARSAIEQSRAGWVGEALERWASASKPILGICLGAQLMHDWLDEAMLPGFGWLRGTVTRLPKEAANHTGWTPLNVDALHEVGLGKRLGESPCFYFNHQFALPRLGAAGEVMTRAGITALIRRGQFTAVQFHPEKSQATGRQLIRNIIEESLRV